MKNSEIIEKSKNEKICQLCHGKGWIIPSIKCKFLCALCELAPQDVCILNSLDYCIKKCPVCSDGYEKNLIDNEKFLRREIAWEIEYFTIFILLHTVCSIHFYKIYLSEEFERQERIIDSKISAAIAYMERRKYELMNEIRKHPTVNYAENIEFKVSVSRRRQLPIHRSSDRLSPNDTESAYPHSMDHYGAAWDKSKRQPTRRKRTYGTSIIFPKIQMNSQRQRTEDLIDRRGKVLGGEKGRELPSLYHETNQRKRSVE